MKCVLCLWSFTCKYQWSNECFDDSGDSHYSENHCTWHHYIVSDNFYIRKVYTKLVSKLLTDHHKINLVNFWNICKTNPTPWTISLPKTKLGHSSTTWKRSIKVQNDTPQSPLVIRKQEWTNLRLKPCPTTPKIWSTKEFVRQWQAINSIYHVKVLDRLRKMTVLLEKTSSLLGNYITTMLPVDSSWPSIAGQPCLNPPHSWPGSGKVVFVSKHQDRPKRSSFWNHWRNPNRCKRI